MACALPLSISGAVARQATTAPSTTSAPASQPTEAIDPKLSQEIDRIDRMVEQIHDLSADFEQLKHTALLKQPLRSSGTLRIKGSMMRWDTVDPQPSTMTISESELRIYYPRQRTVEVYAIDQRMADIAASPLPRLSKLSARFAIARIEWRPQNVTVVRPLSLELTPREQELRDRVERVRVVIDLDTACVAAAEIVYPDRDRTELTFKNVRINTGLTDDDVTLQVPKGTTVTRPLDQLTNATAPSTRPGRQAPAP